MFFRSLGLLLAAAPALAQTTPALTPIPRYYVGLSAYSSYYNPLNRPATAIGLPLPLQLTAGYQLSPRLAVQASAAYLGFHDHFATNQVAPSSTGYASYSIDQNATVRQASLAVLARYTLTRNLAHRLQFDALAGLGLERIITRVQGTQTDNFAGPAQRTDYDYSTSRNTWLLTAGLGARYRLCSRLELTSELLLNREIKLGTSGPALSGAAALGLRYRFGGR